MKNLTGEHKKLLFRYAVLNARFQIREFFLKNTVKELYENVGQVLSLVRMQLASFALYEFEKKNEAIIKSGDLVGKSIRDLRAMCRSFYPDNELRNENGFTDGIEVTLRILHPGNNLKITVEGTARLMPQAIEIIVFKIIHDILIVIRESAVAYKDLVLSYTEEQLEVRIKYSGQVINIESNGANTDAVQHLTIHETVDIIGGVINFVQGNIDETTCYLKVPLNNRL